MLMKTDWCCTPARENPLKEIGLSNSRKKIWELEHYFFCSIIGTCLNPAELKRLVSKSRLDISGIKSDYEMHQLVVSHVGHESSRLAKLVNKHLDKKYKQKIQQALELESARELDGYWDSVSKSAQIHGDYWAVITHPLSSEKLCQKAYGHVHMLSHLLGESVRDHEQKLSAVQKQLNALEARYQKSLGVNRQRIRKKNAEIDQLQEEVCRNIAAKNKRVSNRDSNLDLRIAAEDLSARLNMERLRREQLEDELRLSQSTCARLQDKLSQTNAELETWKLNVGCNHKPDASATVNSPAIDTEKPQE